MKNTRIIILLILISILNIVDLYLTIFNIDNFNFIEVNHIANYIIINFGNLGLIFYKFLTMITTCVFIYISRKRKKLVEAVCWVMFLFLFLLIVYWYFYTIEVVDAYQKLR